MMMGSTARKLIIAIALFAFIAAWVGVVITYMSTDSVASFTIAVTIAALATEALFWVAAVIGGWTIFANRKALWKRLTGQSKHKTEAS
jgi:ABC-type maltose transport system permease subunit